MKRTTSDLNGFALSMPDGSNYTYGLYQSASNPRFYLTAMADPYGNEVTINYDSDFRISTINTDALSTAVLTFVYEYDANGDPVVPATSANSPEDYLIKEVVGPQGRYASFNYNNSYQLENITDMAGLPANFGYGTTYMSRMITPYGQTSFEYPTDSNVSRVILITDPEGQQERFEFSRADMSAVLGTETAPPGASKGSHFTDDLNTFHWDKRAMETAVNTDGSMDYSQALLYHWMQADSQRASSVLHSIKRPLENREWLIYDDSPDGGATIGETNRASASSRYVKDETGATVLRTISFEYNALGKPIKAIDPQGREVKMTYASNGIDLLKVEQRTGAGANDFEVLTDLDYDEDNDTNIDFPRLPSLVEGADGVVLDMTYNTKGQILSVTRKAPDGLGGYTDEGTSDYTYFTNGTGETYGFLQKVEGPSVDGVRPTTSYTYDIFGRVHTTTDTESFKLTYDYDDLDRATKVSYPDGTYTANLYEPFSEGLDLVAFIDRLGRMSQFRHDDLGRVVQSIDPKGQSTVYNWCGCGSLTSITDPLGKTTTWMRDVQGRVEKKIYDDDSEISYTYEPESGLLSTVTDQRDFVKQFKYFVDGNIEEISFNDGGTADPDYIDAPTVNYTYEDYFNRTSTLTTEGTPDDYTYSYYGFTGNGNANRRETVTINKLRDAVTISNDIDYSYDSLGRLYTRSFKGDTETYLYDELDRLDDLSDPLGDFDYSYEDLTLRILAVQHSVSGVNGIRTDLSYEHKTSGGQERKVPYLESILHSTGNGTIASHRYIRNDNGRIDLWQQFDGNDWTSQGYRYDQADQLQTARKFDGLDENSALLERNEFRYDRAGNRSLFQDASGQINASHNDLNQLTAQSGEDGTLFYGTISEAGKVFVQQLDGSNNVLKSQEAELHSGNEFYANLELPVGSNTVRIKATDIHGEATTQDYSYNVAADIGDSFLYDDAGNMTDWTKADGTHIEYKWDAANRLRSIKVDSVQIQSFEYDGAGRMTRATDASGSRNDYFWDGLERLGRENVDVSPAVYRRYLTSGFTESLDGATPESYYVTRDHLGSTREILDDTYAVVAKYDYTAWGEVEKLSGVVNADLLYTGHLYFADFDTPLHLAPYRAYQPELGRWLSRDLIGELGPDGTNTYGYTQNSPVNLVDGTGLWSTAPKALAIAASFGAVTGAFEGAIESVGFQALDNALSSNCNSSGGIDGGRVLEDAAIGAVIGGLTAGIGTKYQLFAKLANRLKSLKHISPNLGRKLDFVFGKATGSAHNINRSQDMLRQLDRIGLHDNPASRKLLEGHLGDVLNNASNILKTQSNGRVVRESLLMGPNGSVKMESIWEGSKLITVKLFGGG